MESPSLFELKFAKKRTNSTNGAGFGMIPSLVDKCLDTIATKGLAFVAHLDPSKANTLLTLLIDRKKMNQDVLEVLGISEFYFHFDFAKSRNLGELNMKRLASKRSFFKLIKISHSKHRFAQFFRLSKF